MLLKDRVKSAAVLVAVVLPCVFISVYTRVIFFAVAAIVCMYEEAKHFRDDIELICPAWVLHVYFVAHATLVLLHASEFAQVACFTLAVYAILFEGVRRGEVAGKGAVYGLATLLFPGFLFVLVISIAASDYWLEALVIGCASTWICDTFALFGGISFGKHKLAPNVSPKKTWEGALCGAASSVVTGIMLYFVFKNHISPMPLWFMILAALVSSTMGQLGDLAESLIKRYVGCKDFSSLIPGHGGMFDRADSLLWSIPTTYFLIRVFLHP